MIFDPVIFDPVIFDVVIFDVVIKGGIIFDGTGQPRFIGDLGIKDGDITRIDREGQIARARAVDVIEVQGLHV